MKSLLIAVNCCLATAAWAGEREVTTHPFASGQSVTRNDSGVPQQVIRPSPFYQGQYQIDDYGSGRREAIVRPDPFVSGNWIIETDKEQ